MHYVGFSHVHKLKIPIIEVPKICDSGIQVGTSNLRHQMFEHPNFTKYDPMNRKLDFDNIEY
jgi:hypothetical protein